MSHQKF